MMGINIGRVNVRSDCVVGHFEPRVVCQICDREGHSQISCEYGSSRIGQNMSATDWMFWQFVDPSDRPEGMD